jgi:hypothetical protein
LFNKAKVTDVPCVGRSGEVRISLFGFMNVEMGALQRMATTQANE